MSKRKRFVITSILLSLGFVGMQFVKDSNRFLGIGVLSVLTLLFFIWGLHEGLGKKTSLLSLILPTLFTLGVGLFWFLLPANIFTRIPIVIFYGLGIYGLCLTSNIYTVAAIRTIALLRAARGVGFVLSLVTSFLLFDTILSLKAPVWINAILVILVCFPIFLQGLWSVLLAERISGELVLTGGIFSLIMGEIAIMLYFWPVTVAVGSLFLTVAVYMLLGLGQSELEERLFSRTVREYLYVALAVIIGMFFATRWGA